MQAGQSNDLLARIQVVIWLLLAIMTAVAWWLTSGLVAMSIAVGGLVANLSFVWLKRDLVKLLAGPLDAAKVRFFFRYYLRLALVVAVLFFLVKSDRVHIAGLLLGLSTVYLGILGTTLGAWKRFHFSVKEAL
jgi:hypothetical protein